MHTHTQRQHTDVRVKSDDTGEADAKGKAQRAGEEGEAAAHTIDCENMYSIHTLFRSET